MKRKNKQQSELIALYNEIPTVKGCKIGCNECCGVVPINQQEQINLGINRPFTASPEQLANNCLDCELAGEGGCSKYEHRPFMCRLFGAVEGKQLECPYGAKADKPLSAKRAATLRDRYIALTKDSSAKTDEFMNQLRKAQPLRILTESK
ncbi:YkgJ family cysteine cluster protein [Vibrio coralliirubri]|uniref:YkgJ family cysteine cluster protein n=1 Tax=Vibrio coralliirubri TaxID=1516159 RepID=UPI002284FB16|nr:YkgJ family cysteine cluster protein [Vibrio coralliirubri]MCY9861421.1 YkgJ family cysteine cluster protein [Vibrio coralliirubri]